MVSRRPSGSIRALEFSHGMQLPADYLRRTGYRLPTEAEWEFAARAGTTTSRFFGYSDPLLSDYAWFSEIRLAPKDDPVDPNDPQRTSPVGRSKPNPLGLFDVYGNVWEWTQNRVRRTRLAACRSTSRTTVLVVSDSAARARRGGGFPYPSAMTRSAARGTVYALPSTAATTSASGSPEPSVEVRVPGGEVHSARGQSRSSPRARLDGGRRLLGSRSSTPCRRHPRRPPSQRASSSICPTPTTRRRSSGRRRRRLHWKRWPTARRRPASTTRPTTSRRPSTAARTSTRRSTSPKGESSVDRLPLESLDRAGGGHRRHGRERGECRLPDGRR